MVVHILHNFSSKNIHGVKWDFTDWKWTIYLPASIFLVIAVIANVCITLWISSSFHNHADLLIIFYPSYNPFIHHIQFILILYTVYICIYKTLWFMYQPLWFMSMKVHEIQWFIYIYYTDWWFGTLYIFSIYWEQYNPI